MFMSKLAIKHKKAVIGSAKEVMVSSALVSLCVRLQDYAKTTRPIFTKFGVKASHGPRKKSTDFGGNPGHVVLRFRLRLYGKVRAAHSHVHSASDDVSYAVFVV